MWQRHHEGPGSTATRVNSNAPERQDGKQRPAAGVYNRSVGYGDISSAETVPLGKGAQSKKPCVTYAKGTAIPKVDKSLSLKMGQGFLPPNHLRQNSHSCPYRLKHCAGEAAIDESILLESCA